MAWSRKSLKISAKNLGNLKKTVYGESFKILFGKDSLQHRSTSCVWISWNLAGWPEIGRVVHYLPDKRKFCLAPASALIAPKTCQGQQQTMFSECSRFHANRFTSSGVIAKRVNSVKTHRKVFPIFGSSSWIMTRIWKQINECNLSFSCCVIILACDDACHTVISLREV